MKYAFYSHGGCENHGCEAIVRTLSAMIKKNEPDSEIKLYTLDAKSDMAGKLPNIDRTEEFNYIRPATTTPLQKIKISMLSKRSQGLADEYFYSLSCKNPSLRENDIYISVGGDNYCYGDGHMAAAFNRELKRLEKKTVLWGCSIGEEDITEGKLCDLKSFDLIVARETMTYNTLVSHGIDKNTVLYPDPAFTLDVDEKIKNRFAIEPNTLGFNISPLIVDCSEYGDKLVTMAVEFLRYVLKSGKGVALIPHVTRANGGDQLILDRIARELNSEQVTLIPETLTAAEYKGIISQCDMFIGSRTHATIAAYSTGVPTLVMGYSVKSKGIARDIFSTYDGLVLPVSEISSAQKMIDAYDAFLSKKEEYRNHLKAFMPSYIERAAQAVKELNKI